MLMKTRVLRPLGVFGLIFMSISSVARSAGYLDGLGLLSPYPTGDSFVGYSMVVVAIILITAFAVGILSIESLPISFFYRLNGRLQAKNLFLKVKIQVAPPEAVLKPPVFSESNGIVEAHAYLRELSFEEVVLVLQKNVTRGSMVRLDLSSLPSFYKERCQIMGEVIQVKSIGNENDFTIKVKFAMLPKSVKEPLTHYIERLTI